MDSVVLISLLLNAIAVLLVVWLVYKGSEALREFRPYIKEVGELRSEMMSKANEIVAQATAMADQIVANARITSERNLANTETLLKQMQDQLNQGIGQTLAESKLNIQTITRTNLEIYEKQLLELNRELEQHSLELKKRLLDESTKKIDEIADVVPNQLLEMKKEIDTKIEEKLSSVDAQVSDYREQKLKAVDSRIYQLLIEIAKKVVGRSIDPSSHEELVVRALEKAKKEGFFS